MDKRESGFCVPYSIRMSPGKGRGVFIDTTVPKGTILWRHIRGLYTVYDESTLKAALAKLSPSEAIYELTHMFGLPEFPNHIIRILDDSVLINHAPKPTVKMISGDSGNETLDKDTNQNIQSIEDTLLQDRFKLTALRDLVSGEELTLDYEVDVEDPEYFEQQCEQYGVEWPF